MLWVQKKPGAEFLGQECMRVLGGHRCVMERRQEKEAGLHFLCDKCHGQEVRLYSGIMGNHCLTLGFETGNDMIRVKFNSAQHLV